MATSPYFPQPSAPPLSLPPTIVLKQEIQQIIDRLPRKLAPAIVELIRQSHLPNAEVVTEDQQREMALKSRILRQILVGYETENKEIVPGCEAAKPKLFTQIKRVSHPQFEDTWEIQKLFEEFTRVAKAVKALRGGLELSHIGEGTRIIRYFSNVVIPAAKGSKKYIDSLSVYSNEKRNVTRKHWGYIWENEADYGSGEIYAERVDMVFRAIDANQLKVEEALSPEYLAAEKERQAKSRANIPKLQAQANRALQGVNNARQAAMPRQVAPMQTGAIVTNNLWSPSNGANYIAYQPLPQGGAAGGYGYTSAAY